MAVGTLAAGMVVGFLQCPHKLRVFQKKNSRKWSGRVVVVGTVVVGAVVVGTVVVVVVGSCYTSLKRYIHRDSDCRCTVRRCVGSYRGRQVGVGC